MEKYLEERLSTQACFDKAPLTMLTSQPLRAGQVRVNLPALTRLYAQVENRREPLLLEGAFRLACLVRRMPCSRPQSRRFGKPLPHSGRMALLR